MPVLYVCFTTFMFDAKIFDAESVEQRRRRDAAAAAELDEARDKGLPAAGPATARQVGRWCVLTVVWLGFATMLAGYCTAVFVMTQFALNVALFVAVAGTVAYPGN